MSHFRLIFAAFMFFGAGLPAHAGDICDYYRRTSPEVFKLICSGGNRHASVAGTHSSFSDSFNLNAGGLPTEPSSYGLEVIGSYLRQNFGAWNPEFALVKGYHKIGTGISTSGNNTFYGNDVLQRLHGPASLSTFTPIEAPKGYVSNLNVGAALNLIESRRGLSMSVGLSGRYNKTTNTFGGGPGILLGTTDLSVGFGLTREKVSNHLNSIYFGSFLVSAKLSFLEFEYQLLKDSADLGLDPIHILSASAVMGRINLTAAVRRLNYLQEGTVVQPHFALQILLSKVISVAFLWNHIPGANSLAVQYFL